MASVGQTHEGLVARPFLFTVLVATLSLGLMIAGCTCGDPEITDDPTQLPELDAGGTDDVVDLPDDDFAGDGTRDGGVAVDDFPEDTAPAVVLQDVFFDYDKAEISSDGRDALAQNSRLLRDNASLRILVEGHCDERGTIQYNLALGERRALEVKNYLMSLGVGGTRIDVVSYGKERPFVMGSTESSWSQNRRAHFVVLN